LEFRCSQSKSCTRCVRDATGHFVRSGQKRRNDSETGVMGTGTTTMVAPSLTPTGEMRSSSGGGSIDSGGSIDNGGGWSWCSTAAERIA
jgi:hypothetical protein